LHGTEQNEAVQGIRTILLEKVEKPSKLNEGTWKIFRNFITNPNNDDELLDLIRRFEWNTKAPEAQSLGTILERLLIERQHATDNIQAQEQYQKLFVYVFKRLCKREIKRLTVEERERLLSQPTLSQTDHQLLNKVVVWVQALEVRVQKNEERLGTIEQRLDQEFSKPYAGQDVASRVQELIRDYTTKLFVGREDALVRIR
jgi:TorA maturation chaperone TorD